MRGYVTASSGTGAVSSVNTAFSGWTTANPVAGDLLVIVFFVGNTAAGIAQSSGTGTWTLPSVDSNSGSPAFTTTAAWRVMGASDTAPSFSFTTSRYSYIMAAFAPAVSWPASPVDAEGTVLVSTAGATSFTPGAATAAASGELSLIFFSAEHTATGASAIAPSEPSGWTEVGSGGGYGGVFAQHANLADISYQAPVGSGSVAPGAITTGAAGASAASAAIALS